MAARATASSRSRRQPARQPAQRRWLAPLLTLGPLLIALGGAAFAYHYLSQPGRLPLRVIEVDGEFRQLEPAQIQATVMQAIDGGFFSCDMRGLRAAVLAMPWVADVSIRRAWPDTLRMHVIEEVPLARWGEDALINLDASVFTPPSLEGYTGLVRLSGPPGSQRRVVDFLAAVVPAARTRELTVREIELDARRHWWIRFDGGLTLSLGREDVAHRLAQFFRVYPSLVAQPQRQPERIDMRYEHGFAVRWRESAGKEAGMEQEKAREKA
jgi:cell division protein FtsQ